MRACARTCVWAHPHPHRVYEHFTPPSTARRRLAGVLLGDGLQREHRRVEHRASHVVFHRMRRFGRRVQCGGRARCGAAVCAAAPRHRRCVYARMQAREDVRASMCVRVRVRVCPREH
jgi:hypothetical protein